MKLLRIWSAILLVVYAGITINGAAIANYILPRLAEDYSVIPDSWKLVKSSFLGDFDRLEVVHKGKTYAWPIDRFLLADRTDSNTICTGSYMSYTREYLITLSRSMQSAPLRVEVVAEKKGDPLKVAGVWLIDFKQSWDRATQQGSHLLNLSAEKVRALKSSEGYEKKAREFSEQQWDLVAKR